MVLLMFFQALYFEYFLSFYTMQLEPPKKKGFKGGLAWIKSSKKDMVVTFTYQICCIVLLLQPLVFVFHVLKLLCSMTTFHSCLWDSRSLTDWIDLQLLRAAGLLQVYWCIWCSEKANSLQSGRVKE